MGFPAARVTDMHVCPMVTGVVPHVGGPIMPPGAPTVLTGGLFQARMSDLVTCVGPPDVIIKGSATVLVMGLPAARVLDTCAHGGVIILGCFTVLIGDGGAPAAAMTPPQVRAALGAAAFPGQQNANNCGVQSSGEIIFLATGERISEADLLAESMAAGRADPGIAGQPASPGGTTAGQRQAILAAHGVESDVVPTSREAMGDALRDGNGVIVNVDAGTLWGTNQHGGHAVVVTDGTYDADGNLETVTVNDTGNGSTRTMPADDLFEATEAREDNGQGASQMNVTRNPVMP